MNRAIHPFLKMVLPLILLLTCCQTAQSADRGTELVRRLHQGNSSHSAGNYQEAITIYRSLIAEYGFSPELLHNLGNSYAADGQYGQAVLNYMRGLRIDPGDPDLEADLGLVRKQIGLFNEERSTFARFLGYYDMNQWLARGLAAYLLITILLALHLRFPKKKGFVPSSWLLAGIFVVCAFGAYSQLQNWYGGVVIKPDSRLLLSPFSSAASNGSLTQGSMVYSRKTHDDYHFVIDEQGRSGWIPTASFEFVSTMTSTYRQDSAEQ